MQTIIANNYPIHFNEKGYEALNLHLKENKYSKLFIVVDNNTNENCAPQFLPFLESDITIEIIEFDDISLEFDAFYFNPTYSTYPACTR